MKRFATAFPGEILAIKSGDIDRWLRSLNHPPVTRTSLHRCIKVFFSFAKSRSYLAQSEATAAELVPIAKEGETKTEIFKPGEMIKLVAAASSEELALLAIGGFAGLRMAEIKRLDWQAVNLDRRIITLRADQANTASRRIVPISDNLAAWIKPLALEGKVVDKVAPDLTKLAEKLGMGWPRNALRHSYISYRPLLAEFVAQRTQSSSLWTTGGSCGTARLRDKLHHRYLGIATRRGPLLLPVYQCALADAEELGRIPLAERLFLTPLLESTGAFSRSHPFGQFHAHLAEIRRKRNYVKIAQAPHGTSQTQRPTQTSRHHLVMQTDGFPKSR